ncbi:MAG TPA: prepilin-type N-terminal cleavage/methylation domain-containing protein [Phycisphaerae bacterium]|jgi:prepilin-type N-terminal cleavage/methylation domain-containing protein
MFNPQYHGRRVTPTGRAAFTLVELLTVIFIIGLLISILLPAMSNARKQAKDLVNKATLNTIEKALEQFRTDNETEFRPTNGYPPSYWDTVANQPVNEFLRGEDETETGMQSLYGAQWLVRYLLGKDAKGFVPKKNVPSNLLPNGVDNGGPNWLEKDWYKEIPPPVGLPLDRAPTYLDPSSLQLRKVAELTGTAPPEAALWPDLVKQQGVIVDKYDHPILYYVANPVGRAMCTPATLPVVNPDAGGVGETGIYRQSDNAGITGYHTGVANESGWAFEGGGVHPLGKYTPTGTVTPSDGLDLDKSNPENWHDTFMGYIHDHNAHRIGGIDQFGMTKAHFRHQPVNKDRFILISAGKDGLYGTKDDTKNFERE